MIDSLNSVSANALPAQNLKRNNYQNIAFMQAPQQDTVELSTKQGISTGAKIGLGALILAGGAAAIDGFFNHGKNLKKIFGIAEKEAAKATDDAAKKAKEAAEKAAKEAEQKAKQEAEKAAREAAEKNKPAVTSSSSGIQSSGSSSGGSKPQRQRQRQPQPQTATAQTRPQSNTQAQATQQTTAAQPKPQAQTTQQTTTTQVKPQAQTQAQTQAQPKPQAKPNSSTVRQMTEKELEVELKRIESSLEAKYGKQIEAFQGKIENIETSLEESGLKLVERLKALRGANTNEESLRLINEFRQEMSQQISLVENYASILEKASIETKAQLETLKQGQSKEIIAKIEAKIKEVDADYIEGKKAIDDILTKGRNKLDKLFKELEEAFVGGEKTQAAAKPVKSKRKAQAKSDRSKTTPTVQMTYDEALAKIKTLENSSDQKIQNLWYEWHRKVSDYTWDHGYQFSREFDNCAIEDAPKIIEKYTQNFKKEFNFLNEYLLKVETAAKEAERRLIELKEGATPEKIAQIDLWIESSRKEYAKLKECIIYDHQYSSDARLELYEALMAKAKA